MVEISFTVVEQTPAMLLLDGDNMKVRLELKAGKLLFTLPEAGTARDDFILMPAS